MYAGYFGLQQDPFSIAPDPRYLFLSAHHREALAHLLYGVQGSGGIVLLTGDIGTGKTTVFRCFVEQVPPGVQVAYIFNPKLSAIELLRTICDEFGVHVRADGSGPASVKAHIDPLNTFLLDLHAQGKRAVLVIDEAQNLSADVLEQLRLLTNLETAECKLLQIVLIGQPELRRLLAQPELEQLSQRVVARYHLRALIPEETRQYIRHRLDVAGWQGPLPMTDRAVRMVHRITGGVPRRINLLCDRTLLGAYANQQTRVTAAMVRQAAGEVFDASASPKGQPGLPGLLLAALGVLIIAASAWWLGARQASVNAAAPQTQVESVAVVNSSPPSLATDTVAVTQPVATAPERQLGGMDSLRKADLWSDENPAWEALMPLWGQPAKRGTDPCRHAQENGLQCFRTWRMTLDGMRHLNRPAILTIETEVGKSQRLLLLGEDSEGALLLGKDDDRWRLTPEQLAGIWKGAYATLWRTPPGTRERIVDARQPEQRRWITERLLALKDKGLIEPESDSYEALLGAFQARSGVEQHRLASPMTLMQLNQASGVDEPRLRDAP